ncbi:MAG TPA: molybdopterin-dependent oxidoreductase, partial [Kineosporiaceae bacterium]
MTTQDRLPGRNQVGAPTGRARSDGAVGAVDALVGDARRVAGAVRPFVHENDAAGGGTGASGGEAGASGGGTDVPSSPPRPKFPQRPPGTGPVPYPGGWDASHREAGSPGHRWGRRRRPVAAEDPDGPDGPDGPDLGRGPRDRAWPWAVAGLAAGVAGLGVAELVAILAGPTSTPLIAAAQAFIDLTPPWLKDFAVRTFGTYDKLALLSGASLVVGLLSAVTGVLARRRPVLATAGAVGLGAVGVVAALTRPNATPLFALPAATGAVIAGLLLLLLRRRGRALGPDGRPGTARRKLLLASGIAVVGGGVAGVAGRAVNTSAGAVEASRAAVRLPTPVARPRALPATVDVGVPGVVPFRVPNADFYRIDTATVVPRLSTTNWRLRIHGMVRREVQLDYQTLMAGALVERDVTLICVSNEVGGKLIGNARWLGLPIGPLLAQAGPLPTADMVLSKSVDGWTAGTPLGVLTDGRDALLAVAMNGVPLPIEHGFPVRMVVPGLYGYVSATKWVVDLEVTRFDRA